MVEQKPKRYKYDRKRRQDPLKSVFIYTIHLSMLCRQSRASKLWSEDLATHAESASVPFELVLKANSS